MPINTRQGNAQSILERGNLNYGAGWGSPMVNLCPGRELDQNLCLAGCADDVTVQTAQKGVPIKMSRIIPSPPGCLTAPWASQVRGACTSER